MLAGDHYRGDLRVWQWINSIWCKVIALQVLMKTIFQNDNELILGLASELCLGVNRYRV